MEVEPGVRRSVVAEENKILIAACLGCGLFDSSGFPYWCRYYRKCVYKKDDKPGFCKLIAFLVEED